MISDLGTRISESQKGPVCTVTETAVQTVDGATHLQITLHEGVSFTFVLTAEIAMAAGWKVYRSGQRNRRKLK